MGGSRFPTCFFAAAEDNDDDGDKFKETCTSAVEIGASSGLPPLCQLRAPPPRRSFLAGRRLRTCAAPPAGFPWERERGSNREEKRGDEVEEAGSTDMWALLLLFD